MNKKDITCITPTYKGRERFLDQCKKYVERFGVKHIVADKGSLHNTVKHLIYQVDTKYMAFILDDDWYSPHYLYNNISALSYSGAKMIGYDPTIYYHIIHRGHMRLSHRGRSSLYTIVGHSDYIRPLLLDNKILENRNCDIGIELWRQVTQLKMPNYIISSGITTVGQDALNIKHVIGRGHGHVMPADEFQDDDDWFMFDSMVGDDADFYKNLAEELKDEL